MVRKTKRYAKKQEDMYDESQIVITIDLEWSPQPLIDMVLAQLREHRVKATLFATHRARLGRSYEVAIHPNYKSVSLYKKTLDKLLKIFPSAKGVRAHGLLADEKLLPLYREKGILYTSNYMMSKAQNIRPFYTECDIMEIPLYYMDRNHFTEKQHYNNSFSIDVLNLDGSGLKVFDFHPIHIFLNTERADRYTRAKRYYKKPEKLKAYVNKNSKGIGTLFNDLLDFLADNKIKAYTMMDIYKMYS